MRAYADLTHDVLIGPRGARIAALLDLDGTLIATHSVKDLFLERLRRREVSIGEARNLLAMGLQYRRQPDSIAEAMRASIHNLAGMPEQHFAELCESVCEQRLLREIYPEMRALVRAHREMGHTIAIVTSASRYQADPIARDLGIAHTLCTELEVRDGRFTGEIVGKPCFNEGKVERVERFSRSRRIDLQHSYFYSDGGEDVPLLTHVGRPVAINPDPTLSELARERRWPAYRFSSRGDSRLRGLLRGTATFASVMPAFAAGLPLRLLGASRREALNFSIGAWSAMASVIAGLELIVEGEENLWRERPAVFLFNHQSAIDTLITARLLRQDLVPVAKQEVRRQPFLGPALGAAGAVFVDRGAGKDPRAVLKPALDALRSGLSVVMAPEGTRSRDGTLGPFRKGAFHLAQQAGVALVPIVIFNALDALPNHGFSIHPAEVRVRVLAPVATNAWRSGDIDREVRRMHALYTRTLAEPDGRPATRTPGRKGRG